MLENLSQPKPDIILETRSQYRSDPRPQKIDLGVGVYKDASGSVYLMDCVRKAQSLICAQETTKNYIGVAGDPEFSNLIIALLTQGQVPVARCSAVETVGGTGALRVILELIKSLDHQGTVWISDPTWPNHVQLAHACRFPLARYRYAHAGVFEIDSFKQDLQQAKAGDIVIVHGCCHNPTGADPSPEQWKHIAQFCRERSLFPLIDLAYLGFGQGIEEDSNVIRIFADTVAEFAVAFSCSKAFTIYSERIGCALVFAEEQQQAQVYGNLCAANRVLYSMPPKLGAEIVRTILATPEAEQQWRDELTQIRQRVDHLRAELVRSLTARSNSDRFLPIQANRGMFSTFRASAAQIRELREVHAVYMIEGGRMNIAGLTSPHIDRVADAMIQVGI